MKPEMTQFFSNQIVSRTIIVFCFILLCKFSFAQAGKTELQITIPDYSGTAKILLDQISQEENIVFAYTSAVFLDFEV